MLSDAFVRPKQCVEGVSPSTSCLYFSRCMSSYLSTETIASNTRDWPGDWVSIYISKLTSRRNFIGPHTNASTSEVFKKISITFPSCSMPSRKRCMRVRFIIPLFFSWSVWTWIQNVSWFVLDLTGFEGRAVWSMLEGYFTHGLDHLLDTIVTLSSSRVVNLLKSCSSLGPSRSLKSLSASSKTTLPAMIDDQRDDDGWNPG